MVEPYPFVSSMLVLRMRTLAMLVGAACCMPLLAAEPVAEFPSKPVKIIVTFPPGGGTDIVARTVGPRLAGVLKQPVLIENRGGASGTIGTDAVAKAPADGYTLLFGTTAGLVMGPLMMKLPYDPVKDLAPVSLLLTNPLMLVVNSSMPIHSVKELITYAKANPGKLNYASVGNGSPNHISTEMLKWLTAINLVHVPYKGVSLSITDMLGGQIQVMFSPMPALMPHIQSGKFRALGVSSSKRAAAAPDQPTMIEAGVPGFNADFWYAIFAPGQTPAAIIAKLNGGFVKILAEPDLIKSLADQGTDPRSSTPAELGSLMQADIERMGNVIKAASIKAE